MSDDPTASPPLAYILSPECTDAFEREGEDVTALIALSGIEGEALYLQSATIPRPTHRRSQRDQAAVARNPGKILIAQIVNHAKAAIRSARWIANEARKIELIARQSRRVKDSFLAEFVYGDAARV